MCIVRPIQLATTHSLAYYPYVSTNPKKKDDEAQTRWKCHVTLIWGNELIATWKLMKITVAGLFPVSRPQRRSGAGPVTDRGVLSTPPQSLSTVPRPAEGNMTSTVSSQYQYHHLSSTL
jgi:hypothetical protein